MANKSFKLSGSYPAARVKSAIACGCLLFVIAVFVASTPSYGRELERADARGDGASSLELMAAALPSFGTIFAIAVGVTLLCGLALSFASWIDSTRAS